MTSAGRSSLDGVSGARGRQLQVDGKASLEWACKDFTEQDDETELTWQKVLLWYWDLTRSSMPKWGSPHGVTCCVARSISRDM